MKQKENHKPIHLGRFRQIFLCLSTQVRAFFFMDDWKVIPMTILVAGMVAYVTARGMFGSMEGTLKGALALSCVCVWNGFFNSIQVVCRERDVIKREHRNGMFISSYIFSHMIMQAFLCILQVMITLIVCRVGGMDFPKTGFFGGSFYIEIGITLFLVTYTSDMLSLFISCIAKSTTTAMTAMPFMLIFELVFSNVIFKVGSKLNFVTNLSFAKWGVQCIAAQSNYNSLPMTSVWNMMDKVRDAEIFGLKPVDEIMTAITDSGQVNQFNLMVGSYNTVDQYNTTFWNIMNCWYTLILFSIILAVLCIIVLHQIDKDKR